jgi:glucose/arabinose dehydrogenase
MTTFGALKIVKQKFNMIPASIRLLCSTTFLVALAGCSDSSGPSDGGGTLPPGLTLQLAQFITSGLAAPVFLTEPLDDGRIFVVERSGRIRVIRDGGLQTTPFLDITSRVKSGFDRGLLSVAFHPSYATNHFFYVFFTAQPNGDIRIERFTATSNPEVADPASTKLIITIPGGLDYDIGGLVSFGLDGMLYAGLGDGSGFADQFGNGQNFNSLLGSLLRVDVDHGDPYAVPSNNPFVGQANHRGEIWAKGLRNPRRYAFDPLSSNLYIADAGQDAFEEVNVAPADKGGVNYGWPIMQGSECFNASTCDKSVLQLPLLAYGHNPACSITGGYVYRGTAIHGLEGHYLYSDFCVGFLKSLRYENGTAINQKDWWLNRPNVTSFGKDFAGELYLISGDSIFKIVQGS